MESTPASRDRVSVVIPVFNTARYVAEAIQSALSQSCNAQIEIICIDDGSTDGSWDIIRSFGDAVVPIRLESNQGIGGARNAGIEAATGDFITFLDADDYWEQGMIDAHLAALKEDSDLDMSFSRYECFLSPELPEEVRQLRECPQGVLSACLASTMVARMESFRKIGLFNTDLRVGEFIDWFSRANALGLRRCLLEGSFLKRRIHDSNTGITQRHARIDYARVAREGLRRKRANLS